MPSNTITVVISLIRLSPTWPNLYNPSKTLAEYVLVPIPMPRLRKFMRGYNQAEHIAQLLGKHTGLKVDETVLVRITSPRRQATLHEKAKRIENQQGTFAVRGKVTGTRILLVDDVTTTGATLEEAKKELTRAGAQDVRAITVAH
jgi:ComF family protein